MAACLDPDAYTYHQGGGISLTVPTGETWYAMNLMFIHAGNSMYYQRSLDVDLSMILPEGTHISSGNNASFAYICRPSLVTSDPRYQNPRDLYYERIAKLRELPLRRINVHVAANYTMQYQPSTAFPADFEKAMVMHVSTEDLSWLALNNPSGPAVNTFWELNNEHRIRVAERLVVPFKRSLWPEVKVAGKP